jgi:hypothetical protein
MGKLIIRMLIKRDITVLVAEVQRIATETVNYSHGHIHTYYWVLNPVQSQNIGLVVHPQPSA